LAKAGKKTRELYTTRIKSEAYDPKGYKRRRRYETPNGRLFFKGNRKKSNKGWVQPLKKFGIKMGRTG